MEEEDGGGIAEINDRYNASVIMYYDLCPTIRSSRIVLCTENVTNDRIIIPPFE